MKELVIYSDGGSRGNPGPGGAGYLFCNWDNTKIRAKGVFIGDCTNNYAEYTALIEALKDAKEMNPEKVKMFCDSQLLVRQVQGRYKVKSPNLKPLFQQVRKLLDGFKSWQIEHIYREENQCADKMANLAMDKKADIQKDYQIVGKQVADKSRPPLKLAVMLSGSGTTMLNIHKHIKDGNINAQIAVVISSRSQIKGVERAEELSLPVKIVRKKDFTDIKSFSEKIKAVLKQYQVDMVIQAGWLCLWQIPKEYENKVMNIHPSLLPSFGGKGMWGHHVHQAVLDRGCKISGCTVHFCTNEYDKGPIIVQKSCPVYHDDDAEKLAKRVFQQECLAYPQAINLFIRNRIKVCDCIVEVLKDV